MSLNTPAFLFFFLPVTLLLFLLLRPRARGVFLLLASLFFYAWGEGAYLLVLIGSWLGNYFLGLRLGGRRDGKSGNAWFATAIFFNLGVLASFKYAPFMATHLPELLGALGPLPRQALLAHMPLGISFFTFQALAYIMDVRRGLVLPEKNPITVGLAIALFPQIGAGPIIRYHRIVEQLRRSHFSVDRFNRGSRRFIIGLAKKVLLASSLAPVADAVFAVPASQLTAGVGWLGLLCYTLQIYFDFSGYSDMAIGLGALFGFDYPENFSHPYSACSLREFWTRWHISLTTFLRDYVFLPLSSAISRAIRPARLLGIRAEYWIYNGGMIGTMALCGIWHGSHHTFLLWGLYHGVLLAVEQSFLRRWLKKAWTPLAFLMTLLLVMLGWVLFRADSAAHALQFFKALAGLGGGDSRIYYPALYLDNRVLLALAAALLGSGPLQRLLVGKGFGNTLAQGRAGMSRWTERLGRTLLFMVFLLSLLVMAGDKYSPFLYVRF
ncbi:MAG: MBOAT family protein [Acidobacteria bacterium]|jgi:alginate O-acetyltransferase complex protein AlgI|nr:MBOAT family protein [Acidobacteriota bacterium]